MAVESSTDIHALPEGCIAAVLSLTTPKDVCRLSLVASFFRSAAQSDVVWERFLPEDYRDIIESTRFRTKKELFFHLCDHPVIIDGGTKSFSLEKCAGKKCIMLAARELHIVWSDTPRYWQWISLPESRFPEVAELRDVCWFEIRGRIRTSELSSGTRYAAYLVCMSISRVYGFKHHRAESSVGISGHESEKRQVCLIPDCAQKHRAPIGPMRCSTGHLRGRDDGWLEVKLGDCFVSGRDDGDLEISLMEVKNGNWKSGLIVQGIEIRPKVDKH